jgi:hypothetical protein
MGAGQLTSGSIDLAKFRAFLDQAPLAVYDASAARYLPIPASLDPLVVEEGVWRAAAQDCTRVLSAMEKTCAWLRQNAPATTLDRLFGHLAGIEREAAFGRLPGSTGLATVRFDFFFDGGDLRILEVNTTIPAMQAYSDMVHAAFAAGLPPTLATTLGPPSNGLDLLGSLLRHYELSGGRRAKPRIAIVARAGDSQIAELRWLQAAWQRAGHEVLLATPDELSIRGDGLEVGAVPVDFVYRHIFAHRLTPGSDFERTCRDSRRFRIFNPVSAHLEVKGLLAETSRIADSDEQSSRAALTAEEIEAVRRRVPWTRLLTGDDSPTLSSIKERHRDTLVVKTSAGYGGHGVVIGATFQDDASQQRVAAMVGSDRAVSWEEFCAFAATGASGLWVVQERIAGRRLSHRYVARDGAVVGADSYVDCSMFGGLFDPGSLPGGASRFSADPVVNIGRGGGLMPLLLGSR